MEGRSKAIVAGLATLAILGLPQTSHPADVVRWHDGGIYIGGEASGSAAVGDEGWFNETEYNRSLMHLFRLGLTAEVRANEHLALLSEVRTENLDPVSVYALYLRVRPWQHRAFDVQVGRIPPVFGSFARRRYAVDNPLIGYPLEYQYLTTLRPDSVPANADQLLATRGEGWHVRYPVGSSYAGPGSPLVSALRWDTGIEGRVGSVTTGIFEAAIAVTQGTLSDPRTHDTNSGKQISARVAFRPAFGLILGASGASGDFLSDEVTTLLPDPTRRFRQQALGLDVEWSRGYWIVRAEGVYSSWDMPVISEPFLESPVHALGGFAEVRYKLAPGLYVAGRVDHLAMSEITGSTQTLSWDAPVTRVETGLGYSPMRGLWLKGVYQHNWREGGSVRSQGVGAIQASYGF